MATWRRWDRIKACLKGPVTLGGKEEGEVNKLSDFWAKGGDWQLRQMRSNMDGPRGCHPERSQSDREEKSDDISYRRNPKVNDTNKLIHKTETDSQTENEVMVARGRMGKGTVREFEKVMHTLLSLKWITNKDLL